MVRATVHTRVKDEGARPSVICSYLRVALQFIRESAAARKTETCRGVDAGGGADGYLVELAAGDGTLAYTVLHSPTLPWAQPALGAAKPVHDRDGTGPAIGAHIRVRLHLAAAAATARGEGKGREGKGRECAAAADPMGIYS